MPRSSALLLVTVVMGWRYNGPGDQREWGWSQKGSGRAPRPFSQEPEAKRVRMCVLESQPRTPILSVLPPSEDSVSHSCLSPSNVFRLIPGRRRMGESRSTEGRPLQGQRESLPSSQDGRRVVPQGMLLETEQCSERDCPPDACRVPEVARMVYPKAQLLQPARADVLVMTPWFAPVIWDGVFDSAILDAQFENTTVGLTIFAIRK
ncbi:uncharacterized protein LOC121021218 isoform X2 [Herpailurus yagouaroundi]|uniref:uncharacterized protein LOC121021218 isoform X2 n=1 Tax=Herpailurus yagouaroundi TaxID=1608482 RepID=UPI001AD69D14|nr:uncharacterized protein LOC121021218 isoform X2 [Puma yagouaroundi]